MPDGWRTVTVRSCVQCGSHVSARYRQVFGTDGVVVVGCPACDSPVAR